MRHNRPYINWDTSMITLVRNGVGFQLYPAEVHKLLKDTVFVQLADPKGYGYKFSKVDFSKCLVEFIQGKEPNSTTISPPSLRG